MEINKDYIVSKIFKELVDKMKSIGFEYKNMNFTDGNFIIKVTHAKNV